jgi:transcriptional regulator with XRE-family HTH domain
MPRAKQDEESIRFAKALGTVLRVARKQKGIKAESLAYDIGTSAQTLSNWETGKFLPYTPHLMAACKILGLRMSKVYAAAERMLWMQDVMQASAKQAKERADSERREEG